jgi:hypothetical protein
VTPAVDSRHAGAKMSDADFAKLQLRRDTARSGGRKAAATVLTRQINEEIARRKAGSPPAETPEQKVAKAQWSSLSAAASKHGGIAGPPEGGTVTVHFPIPHRAAGFYDQMISAHLSAEFKTGTKIVRVHKP